MKMARSKHVLRRVAFLLVFATLVVGTNSLAADVNVRDTGAVGDGERLETTAINTAVQKCAASGGGRVIVPQGKYLTGTIELKSHVTLQIDNGATILASQKVEDYPRVDDPWMEGRKTLAPLIYASGADHVSISGEGLIDGQGASWWAPIMEAKARRRGDAQTPSSQPSMRNFERPQLVRFVNCTDVVIEHVSLKDSPSWNIHPLFCERVRVDGVTISAHVPSPNTDGINPESCRNVQIMNCRLDVGDDCVTLKSGIDEAGRKMNRPDEDITITNCVMNQGHGGVTIGSEMSGGVHNVVVSNCVFHGTDSGIRIKSQRGRGGVVEGLSVSNIVMQDVPHPFTITTFYMGSDKPTDEYPVNDGTPRFRDMLFSNITARGAKDAGSITGLREMPIEDITFTNVHIQSDSAMTCTNAKQIYFKNVVIDTQSGPALVEKACNAIDAAGLWTHTPHDGTPLLSSDK
jgi:polygalacturonase